MSFVTLLALSLSLLVAAPMVAHLLRRGRAKEQAFPPAALVPEARATTRERSRLEDRGLLLLRALMILSLAVLGAGPLVRCSRVALGRTAGASVALAIVVDDSASMRARVGDATRFQKSVAAAQQLLSSARDGDAVALVLAGKPARLALSAGTDLRAAARAVGELHPTDRATDLSGALALARAALASLPHQDKRIVLLSDLAGELPAEPSKDVWAPLPELATPAEDCGVLRAAQSGQRVVAEVACSSEIAARGRSLRLVGKDGASKAEARLVVQRGEQSLTLDAKVEGALSVVLSGQDQNPDDDRAEVAPESRSLSLAVHADTTREQVATGGAPLLEQALHALSTGVPVRPLPELPREAGELSDIAALFIDDPPGFTPETRGALGAWLEGGAVAALFLGPHAHDAMLGANLEPFVRGAVDWEPLAATTETDVASFAWLGAEAGSLAGLAPKGRARLDSALLPGADIVGRWKDGKVLVSRQEHGRGLLFSIGLPVSIEGSDLPLRPGFLALLDQLVSEALRRRGPRASEAGTEWWFPSSGALQIAGASGPLTLREADGQRFATPEVTGRYELNVAGKRETRFITLAAAEVLAKPARELPAAWRGTPPGGEPQVDASPELGWLLLALLGAEIAVRLGRLARERRAHGAIHPTTP